MFASLKIQDGRFLTILDPLRALAGPQDRQQKDAGRKTSLGERVGASGYPVLKQSGRRMSGLTRRQS
eukprot:8068990-Pyramimonas_sp.AAC.1